MEPDPINDITIIDTDVSDSNRNITPNSTFASIGSDLLHQQLSDAEDSQTEGKPSPPAPSSNTASASGSAIPLLQAAIRQESPSTTNTTDTDRSTSPTRSKKRAIETMLDGEEDKECIVMEKQPPPPLPKRHTPPSTPTKSKISSSSSSGSSSSKPLSPTFMDQPLYMKGDGNYERACGLLQSYRQINGVLGNGAPILDFFDQWIKEIKSNSINVADALFDELLEGYNPGTDEQLVSRIPLVMNQILQRKYPLLI
jgi:hypothetical protein